MGTPYFRAGIYLGDRPTSTTGVSYTTVPLQYNHYLAADWFQSTGATPFTGAYYHTIVLTYGFQISKDESFDDPETIIEFPSGERDGTSTRGPRQILSFTFTNLTAIEAQKWTRFYLLCKQPEGGRVIEYVDEYDNALPGRLRSFKRVYNPQRSKSNGYDIQCSFELEHTSREYTIDSGGLITY